MTRRGRSKANKPVGKPPAPKEQSREQLTHSSTPVLAWRRLAGHILLFTIGLVMWAVTYADIELQQVRYMVMDQPGTQGIVGVLFGMWAASFLLLSYMKWVDTYISSKLTHKWRLRVGYIIFTLYSIFPPLLTQILIPIVNTVAIQIKYVMPG